MIFLKSITMQVEMAIFSLINKYAMYNVVFLVAYVDSEQLLIEKTRHFSLHNILLSWKGQGFIPVFIYYQVNSLSK